MIDMLHHISSTPLHIVPRTLTPSPHNRPIYIWEILPPPSANDMQHHIHFISYSIGTIITFIGSSLQDVEITSPVTNIAPSKAAWTKLVNALSTSLGPMATRWYHTPTFQVSLPHVNHCLMTY